MITERNMVFANPQAYRVFPQIGNPYNTGITDTAIYEGYLQVTDDSGTTKSFANTSTIDFTGFKGVIDIDQYTDTGSVKLGRWRITDTIENDVMSSMVLWYDLAKQGATNESMAADPRLIDHSGNGHHATCYNFAWVGMSGIGGNRSTIISSNNFTLNGGISTTNGTTIHITHTPTVGSSAAEYTGSLKPGQTIKSCYFRITGLTKGITLIGNSGWESVGTISQDGVYITPEFTNQYSNDRYPNLRFSEESLNKDCDVTIQALGSYPHAIVSDGVDDYISVSGLPILTPDKGYTVIAKRKWINEDLSDVTAFLSKASDNMGSDGAFMFEAKDNTATRKLCRSFGKDLILTEEGFHKSDITYQTSVKYNDKPMNTGSGIDTDKLLFFVFSNAAGYNGRFVLYSTILFDRDLTTEEIEWVKTNLIETEQ